jgi:class 3 adenylate cyclase
VQRERKVVTVLFADLVGFTARAESLDPEDVEAILRPYHERLRSELERHGGTVEKFIGDAVMALFGAPTAHEDDPERAVRAALAIRDWAREEADLEVRIGITTGEALVTLGARASEGEGLAAGDVVNTAARLQSAAPVNGILADETTYRATRDRITYAEAEPVTAKGKAEPVPVWEAREARSRFGVDVVQGAQLVGRRRELDLLTDALARAREEHSPQLVTLVGVPGIGKSRLTYELSQAVERDPELINWRQGRSLPYGEGVTYWALAEMAKAQAGILETDTLEEVERKLTEAVADLEPGGAERMLEGLRPLVGLGAEGEPGGDRSERFAAWRQFFESLAEQRPTVLVFEDLQWADDDLLDFVDHLVDWASGVPLLVVCTARPELLERRPGWGGGKTNALTLSISPLSDEDTARLIAELLERAVLPAETQASLLAHAGGNPLYAEQFARLLAESDDSDLPLPENVQGIIAARLDGLPAEEKQLLQDAAVLGKVFWLGAVCAVGGVGRHEAEQRLHALERKEFVRRERRSSFGGENEYAFRHVLARDVAYGQIPRGARAERHERAASWIEALGRTEDHAEMLAHHYLAAIELAGLTGQPLQLLAERARPALREAAERALALSAFRPAARFYEAALDLSADDDPARPYLLFGLGRSRLNADFTGLDVLTDARDALLAAGDEALAAEAEMLIGEFDALAGRQDASFQHFRRAIELVERAPLSRSKAFVTSNYSRWLMLAGENQETIEIGLQALAMAEELGLDDLRSHALNNVGIARIHLDDLSGFDDLRQSVEIAVEADSHESARAYGNLASMYASFGDLDASAETIASGLRVAEHFGHAENIRWMRTERAYDAYMRGRWDEAESIATATIEYSESERQYFMEAMARRVRASIRLARGDSPGAQVDADKALAFVAGGADPQLDLPAQALAAWIFHSTGRINEAARLAPPLLQHWLETKSLVATDWVVDLALAFLGLGREREFAEAAKGATPTTRWLEGAMALAEHDFSRAVETFAKIGSLAFEAYANLLAAEDGRSLGDAALRRTLAFYRSAGAKAYAQRAEALLRASA